MATAKATTKKAKEASEVKTLETLRTELATKRQDLIDARRGLAAGELQNPRVITATRKEIARLSTAIRAAELAEKGDK
ncbi:50S ribosomal protein L29 [Candidatus Mycosynbacter amalyticus]|uniref:Large ribosomal subunit protein uL29 n=1 Tax=Candidatus Mycosynbacter amalyticus TaxID=2665156 RepID=A0A857MP02_9BACT|nr:50S ribosomal protein L29 [Candidatus Mycosynbacter amalyticus]QHN42831.1 50S ribosomal protein L29 [Candidatus Mycosynbacter amalyticus]